MELRENVELIEVVYENNGAKAKLTFLDEEHGDVLEVIFNKQSYDNGTYVDDPEKAEKVEDWSQEYFKQSFNDLNKARGTRTNVYSYPDKGFNSLWESDFPQKFDKEMLGEIYQTQIEEVVDDGIGVRIRYKIDDALYQTNMTYAKYIEERKEWFPDNVKKEKQYAKFEEKFGVSVENAGEIIGKPIIVECKTAFNKFYYGEIKKPKWSK